MQKDNLVKEGREACPTVCINNTVCDETAN